MMKLKTFAYFAFTVGCVGASAALLLNPPKSMFDDPWPSRDQITLAAATPQTTPAPAPAAQPAPAPLPTVIAPAIAENPTAAAIADRLSPPKRLDELLIPELAERRDLPGKVYDASARPVMTPLIVRKTMVPVKTKVPLPQLKSRTDGPALATADPVLPGRPTFAVLPRYSVEDVEPLLPPLRVPLSIRPRPEPVASRDEPILNMQGNAQLHILPVMRNTPAASVRSMDAMDAGYPQPIAPPPPDEDAPVPAQVMPPKPAL